MNASPPVCAPTREGIAAALASAGMGSAAGAREPILVAAGSPLRVVFANPPACALLGAADLDALSVRLLDPARASGRRVHEIASLLPPQARPRLERLRIEAGPRSETITFLLRRLDGPAAPLLMVAQGVHPALLANPPCSDALALPAAQPAPGSAASAALRPLSDVAAEFDRRFATTRKVRFLWQTDASGRLTMLTDHLCQAVGCVTQALIGETFADAAAAIDVEGHEALRAALARRETWSHVVLSWPIQGTEAAVPVSLGALPAYDRHRRFEGFRGYGVIHVAELQHRAVPEPIDAPPSEAKAPHEAASGAQTAAPVVQPDPSGSAEGPPPDFGKNVVPLRSGQKAGAFRPLSIVPASEGPGSEQVQLSDGERLAFREIARALGARLPDGTLVGQPQKPVDAPAGGTAADETPSEPAAPMETAPAASLPQAPSASDAGPPQAADADALVDHLPLGVLVLEGASVAFANRTLLDLLGWPDVETFKAENGLFRAFKGRDPDALASPDGGAVPVVTREGEITMLDMRVATLMREGGPARLFVFRHESELGHRLRALELDLRQREAESRELHAILDTATDGVAVLNEDGRILSINRSCQALFGYEPGEVAGELFTVLLMRESHTIALDYLAGLKTNGVATVLNDGREVLGRARQGGAIQLFMTLGRVGAGGTPKFCAVLRDVTAWKRAERELHEARREAERASAAKSEFLAKVSHEIRTPLNAILGFAEVIMEERFGPVGNARYKDYLKDIHSSGTHVLSLVNDLLDLSKIEAGRMELSPEPVDANRIVAECVSLMQPQANSERVIVRMSLAPRLPNIVTDERSLRQIVINLLSNAVKFNEPGGQVIVSTALTDAGHAVIRIRDTGIGMSEADLETALEPFRQVALARKVSGTGLGLPLTKALVEANRASFSIKSRKNEGTLVEVAYPPTCVVTG